VGDTPPLRDFSITRVFPNPTEDGVRVDYTIGSRAPVELSVYDVTGRVVRRLYAADLSPGDYSARWDGRTAEGREAASGVYFVRLRVAGADVTTRAVRLR
jgi:flagellar hook assembly protein FlgD